MSRLLLLLGFLLYIPFPTARAEPLALAPVFQDSMVLQQGVPVQIWGNADAGTDVTVTLARQRKITRADSKGRWSSTLDAMQADAEPHTLKVVAGDRTLVIRDILVGEVWIAAGQSNIEWPLAKETHAKAELPTAEHPQIRLLNLSYAGQNHFARPFGPDVLQRLTTDEFYRGTWQLCSSRSARDFSAIAYYFGKELHQVLRVPIGIVQLAVGGSPTEAWIRREALAEDDDLAPLVKGNWLANEKLGPWCRQRGRENLTQAHKGMDGTPQDAGGPNHAFKPGFLWNAGIFRLIPLPIRGVIWYQGESNSLEAWRVRQHDQLFKLLVSDWRKQWKIGDFPFLFCQLSSIGTGTGYKARHWPEFRDRQRRMLAEIPNAGMAVTSDLGHPTDVHPRNKKEVGHRLALWALAGTYGRKLSFSGPLPKAIRREGAALVVTFDHAEKGLKTSNGQSATSFEIAGEDGVFWPAVAQLGNDAITLSSNSAAEPCAARYGWQPFSKGNLTNRAGLPASTFLLNLPEN